jgi:hypothetical protein
VSLNFSYKIKTLLKLVDRFEEKKIRLLEMENTCNPSYSGGRDQEDWQFEASPGKQFARPYLKNTQHKKGLTKQPA